MSDPLKMLAEDLALFQHDPYGYVMWAFPWGEGQLRGFDGPRKWQKDFLFISKLFIYHYFLHFLDYF